MSEVFFFVNGPPRLMLAALLAGDRYHDDKKHLMLLDQYGYSYDSLMPFMANIFDSIEKVTIKTERYSHLGQLVNTYFNTYPALTARLKENSTLVVFGLRSPLQKYLVRYFKNHGGVVDVYAESLAVERYFNEPPGGGIFARLSRSLFSRAFGFQHDYDSFHVYLKQLYAGSPHYGKLREMPDFYAGRQFAKLAGQVLGKTPGLSARLSGFDAWFFGQPLSNFDGLVSREQEVSMLKRILGGQKVLVLPHPNEILGPDDKYASLPNVEVFRGKAPNDLLLGKLRPEKTMTYGSTIGLTYAIHNPGSRNYFYPVYASQVRELRRYKQFLQNIEVSDEFVVRERQY